MAIPVRKDSVGDSSALVSAVSICRCPENSAGFLPSSRCALYEGSRKASFESDRPPLKMAPNWFLANSVEENGDEKRGRGLLSSARVCRPLFRMATALEVVFKESVCVEPLRQSVCVCAEETFEALLVEKESVLTWH